MARKKPHVLGRMLEGFATAAGVTVAGNEGGRRA